MTRSYSPIAIGTKRAPKTASPLSRLAHAAFLWRSRRQLARLEVERLADLGLSAEAARRESARPPWDGASGWPFRL